MVRALARILIPGIAALALAGCGGQDDGSETYKTDVEDLSGGELIVSTPDPNAIPVRLPETPMTPVPVDTATPAPAASPSPAPTAAD